MSVPGPAAVPWALGLLLFAVAALPLGEMLRRIGARWTGLLRATDPVEVALLDLYLAGATFFVVGYLPGGWYDPETPLTLLLAGVVGTSLLLLRGRRHGASRRPPPIDRSRPTLAILGLLLLAALSVYLIEVAGAVAAPTGNTFDSSVLTTFVGLVTLHHALPTSYLPILAQRIAYPQGTTAWLATAQGLFGLPPARTSLLVTPLFLALGPLAAYVWGRRFLGSLSGGLAFGLFFAFLASWTRVLVGGSNDFVFAFPLLLLLWSWLPRWAASEPIPWADAAGFGLLAGISASLNPVGAELTFLALPIFVLVGRGTGVARAVRFLSRWGAAAGIGLLFTLPSLSALGSGASGIGPSLASTPATAIGLTVGQIVGLVDPFLFRATDVWFSPFPLLRAELTVLLVLGAGILLVPLLARRRGEAEVGRWAAAVLATVGLLLLSQSSALDSVAVFRIIGSVSNVAELSILLLTAYASVALLPLARALGPLLDAEPRRAPTGAPSSAPRARRRWTVGPSGRPDPLLALLLAGIILVPGVAVTATGLPPYVGELYHAFGNVSSEDFALLSWAGGHLPSDARVLVAPGSAAGFLPGYLPTATILFPMAPGGGNATYLGLVRDLDRGILTTSDRSAMALLGVQYVAVTGANTQLDAPFDPAPLRADPSAFPLLFAEGDAFLFAVAPVAPVP
ncbi:MAG: hypothetical protein ACYDFT_03105 [Thermoplasmata archaeon]